MKIQFFYKVVSLNWEAPTPNPLENEHGLILCKKKSKIKAEYALRDLQKLMSVAEYSTKTQKKLPKAIACLLPPIEEIEEELEKDIEV